MDLNVINLKETFPSIEPKELKAFIKYQIKFSLTLDNLKCLNPDCNDNKKWNNAQSGPAYTCHSIVCKNKMKEQVNLIRLNKIDYSISYQKRKETYLLKTGYEHNSQNPVIKQKKKETYLLKTGYEHPALNPEIKQKIKDNYFKQTGFEHNSQNPIIKQKKKETYLLKTGFENPFQNPEIKQKIKDTNLEKYGYTHPGQNPEVKQKIKETYFTRTGYKHNSQNPENQLKKRKNYLDIYGTTHSLNKHITNFKDWDNKQYWIENFITEDNNFNCVKCMEYFNCTVARTHQKAIELGIEYTKFKGTSLKEQALIPILNNLNIHNIVTNSRTIIGPLELDIYLPDHNLAIEYNGAYWHQDSKKPVDYHQSKSIACLSKGIRLLHIFEGYNDYNLEETLKEFLNYKTCKETGVFDLSTGCYPLSLDYKIQEPELINIMGFNIYDAGKIKITRGGLK